jgi:imidazolonepropionase-like amidohydrolase
MKRALAFIATLLPVAAAQAAAIVLAGGTVIDGYGNPPIPDGIIVIEGDRILAVGGVGQVAIPDGAEIISTEGMTVLPGLWDMQVSLMRLATAIPRAGTRPTARSRSGS